MGNLSILEREALEILRQLERCCQVAEECPEYIEKEKCVHVMLTELDLKGLKNPQRTQDVVSFLQRKGVNFVITFDLINDIPDMYIDNEHPSYEYIELGRINGENLEEIMAAIQSLIQRLGGKTVQKILTIKYKTSLGQLFLNENSIEFVGIQKDTLDILIKSGKEVKVSWDEINEKMEKVDTKDSGKKQQNEAKKKINGAVSEINKKTVKYLDENKTLIKFKNHEYWLQYDVQIVG